MQESKPSTYQENDMEEITQKTCLRCGKIWTPRTFGRPSLCPNCGTAKWDQAIQPNEPGRRRIHNVTACYDTPKPTRDSNGRFVKN